MNHSTTLTKRVMAKKLRDSIYPETLKNLLGLQKELPFKEQEYQNALRIINWKLEVVVFTPPERLNILNLAVKREQEVALRTHIEKIISFTKTTALLNQQHRLHINIDQQEYIIAEPTDFLKALNILKTSIMETVSRIEKRQEEALKLFTNSDISLNKNDVASKLKVSTKTATRALRTLAQAGYLKEEKQGRTNQYQLLQKELKELDLLKNITSISLFHQKSLKNWLNTIETTGHQRNIPLTYKLFNTNQQENIELTSAKHALEHYTSLHPPKTTTCPDAHTPSTNKKVSENQKEPKELDKQKRSTSTTPKPEKEHKTELNSLENFATVNWSNNDYGWHKCAICGHTKLTCREGKTYKNQTAWLCEDCQNKWNTHIETN
jgi:predicted transcriptional regulator